jgi:hypothetical protein
MSGSFAYGENKSKSSQSSSTDAYGYSGSQSGDVSQSTSDSISGGQSSSQQTIAFEDLYRQMYGGATQAAGNVAAQAPQLQQVAQQLFTGGSQFLQSLGGANAGTNYQADRLNSDSNVEDIISSMRNDATSLFTDELNPAITSRAVAGGTLGGGRQGVAQGIAQARVADDFSRNAAALRYEDLKSKDAIAANVAGNSIAAAGTGLGALPGLLDVFERGQNSELAAYSSLSSILGGPTTLASSESTDFGRTTAQSMANAFSRSFGEQTQTMRSTGKSSARGWDHAGSFSYGMGGSGG